MYFFAKAEILKSFFEKQGKITNATAQSPLFRAMLKQNVIYSTEIDERWRNKIYEAHQIRINSQYADAIRQVEKDQSVVLTMPAGVYLLNLDFAKNKILLDEFGTLSFSVDDPKNGQFYQYLYDKNVEYSPAGVELYQKGWESVLAELTSIPSTGMIFIDRYLFKKVEEAKQNIREILENTLPRRFSEKHAYHITFIFDLNELKEKTFENLSKELTGIAKSCRPNINLQVELLAITSDCTPFYFDCHNRRIISNYFILRADNALRAYSLPTDHNGKPVSGAIYNRSNCLQTLTPQRLYTMHSLQTESDPPARSINLTLKSIRKFSNKISQYSPSMLRNSGMLWLHAVNGETCDANTGIQNRLIL